MAKKTAIGIDLGTTYSSLARLSGSLRVLPTSAAVCRGVSGQLDLCVSLFESVVTRLFSKDDTHKSKKCHNVACRLHVQA